MSTQCGRTSSTILTTAHSGLAPTLRIIRSRKGSTSTTFPCNRNCRANSSRPERMSESEGRNLFLRSIANRIVAVRTNPDPTQAGIVIREFDIDNGGTNVLHPFGEVDYKTSGGHD